MTTSFNPTAPTTAPVEPVTPVAAPVLADQSVIEYGGRKLTQAEVLKKLEHADQFIEQLKVERAEDRALLNQATEGLKRAVSAQELLKAPAVAAPASVAATAVDIAAEVDKVVSAREQRAAEEQNWKAAQEAMTKAFGDKADEKAKALASDAGLSFDELVALARTKPKAFNRLFPELAAVSSTAAKAVPSFGVVNTQGVKEGPKATSGFWQAKSSREQTAIYLAKLKQLSGA